MKKKEFWIPCMCGSEGLHIEKDEHDGDIYFAFWMCGQQSMSIRHKLRWIWRIIQGKPWADHIVVDNSQLRDIIGALEGMEDGSTNLEIEERTTCEINIST